MRCLRCEQTRLLVPFAEIDILSGGTNSKEKPRHETLVEPCGTWCRGTRSRWLTPAGRWARPEHRRPPAPARDPDGKQTSLRQAESLLSLRQRRKGNKTGL